MLLSTVPYCSLLLYTVLYFSLIFPIVLFSNVLHLSIMKSTVPYYYILFSAVLYCSLLFSTVLHCSLLLSTVLHWYPLSSNMLFSPTGCCAVQWAMWNGGGLTSRDSLNRSENYLLLGFLLVMPSQSVLLLVSHSVTEDNSSISVSHPSSSKVI